MTKRFAFGILGVLLTTPALAADEAKPKREDAWEIGARAHYVPGAGNDFILGLFYDENMPVEAFTVGGFLTRHSAGGNRVILGASYTGASADDGVWLESGGETPEREWTEIRNMNVFEAHVIIGKEWGFGPFGLFTGAGLGVAVPQGTIRSRGTVPPLHEQEDATSQWDDKDIPPAVPTVIVRIGPTIKLGPMITLYADAGFHNGLYAGAGAGIKF